MDVLQEELDDLGLREAMLFAQPIRDAGERPGAWTIGLGVRQLFDLETHIVFFEA